MDTEKFKKRAREWILDAIQANGGLEEMRSMHRMVPSFTEALLVGWTCGRWSQSDHPERFTLEEMRRLHDLVHLMFDSGSATS